MSNLGALVAYSLVFSVISKGVEWKRRKAFFYWYNSVTHDGIQKIEMTRPSEQEARKEHAYSWYQQPWSGVCLDEKVLYTFLPV